VAEELCAAGEFEAAHALATAVKRPDLDELPRYVAWRKDHPTDAALRTAVAAAEPLMRADRFSEGLDSLAGLEPAGDDVPSVRLMSWRAFGLLQIGRSDEALPIALAAGERAERMGWRILAAISYDQAGHSAIRTGDLKASVAAFARRLSVEEKRGNKAGIAEALLNSVGSLQSLGETRRATDALTRALPLFEEVGDREGLALGRLNRGILRLDLGEGKAAAADFEAAVAEFVASKDRLRECESRRWLGSTLVLLGEADRGMALIEDSIRIAEEIQDAWSVCEGHQILANVLVARGDHGRAVTLLEKAADEDSLLGERSRPATIAQRLGIAYLAVGDFDRAETSLEKALPGAEAGGEAFDVGKILSGLAVVAFERGRFAEAQTYFERARDVARRIGNRPGEADANAGLAGVAFKAGSVREALAAFEAGADLASRSGDARGRAAALLNVGVARHRLGEFESALQASRTARALAVEGGFLRERVAADIRIAMSELSMNRPDPALAAARAAVEGMAPLVQRLSEGEGAAARFGFADAFDVGLAAAAVKGDVPAALYFLESGRAGGLLESLMLRSVSAASLPKELAKAEAAARAEEEAASGALQEAQRGRVDPGAAKARLEKAHAGLFAVIERIQRESKAVADVVYPKAAPLVAIQASLAAGEALLLYGVGQNRATALVVTAKAARIVSLGKAADLRAACEPITAAHGRIDPAAVAALSDLAIRPLALDASVRRILVSPEGPLSYVPFCLLDPTRDVAYVPSGTTRLVLAADAVKKGDGVLALGDPDYGSAGEDAAARAAGWALAPLPATRDEARAVGTVVLLGKDAGVQRFHQEVVKRPRWRAVHLACHGLIDAARPARSALALSPTGASDGFLRVLDVFRASIPADLVVLSACETGKGKVVRGEGVLGLTRAFMFAGAPRVLVSLWKVDDRATKVLMQAFYEAWTKKGLSPAAALVAAQKSVREHVVRGVDEEASRKAGKDVLVDRRPFEAPEYWAGWSLWGVGD
jgi:tetratricopeptide (TPR) repeat protein